jgi:hypothetical protein
MCRTTSVKLAGALERVLRVFVPAQALAYTSRISTVSGVTPGSGGSG